jgi:DUF971 family protein
MRPIDIQPIGEELAIKWDDGMESFIRLESLRRACPCAGCKGEMDVMGNLHKGPEIKLNPRSFVLRRIDTIGGYGLQPTWADGHSSGIFPFPLLRQMADEQQNPKSS